MLISDDGCALDRYIAGRLSVHGVHVSTDVFGERRSAGQRIRFEYGRSHLGVSAIFLNVIRSVIVIFCDPPPQTRQGPDYPDDRHDSPRADQQLVLVAASVGSRSSSVDALGLRHQAVAELEEQRGTGTGRQEATQNGQKDEANAMKREREREHAESSQPYVRLREC